jgi:V/A-type H+/Na+-transporting ATPase subunit C
VSQMSSRIFLGARSFALKGSLLGRTVVETLAESGTLEELVNRLRGTSYANAVSKLQPPFTARRMELAFRERLADVHYVLMRSASSYDIFELYYLRHVAWDLKSAIKSRALNKSYEEAVEYLDLHIEELVGRRDLIAKVLAAKDVQEAVTMLSGTEFGTDIEKALAVFLNTGEVRFFDLYVDHSILSRISKAYARNSKVYSSSRAVDVGGIGELVAIDIDSYNVLSVLRAKLWGLPSSEIKQLTIQPTFKYQLALLQRMIDSESAGEAVKLLQFEVPQTSDDEEAIVSVEDRFAAQSRAAASKAFVWQGLGPANALAMIKLMEGEVRNLSAIAIGVEAHIPTKDILSRLRF